MKGNTSRDYQETAELLKVLANPKRLQILNAIKTEPVTVNGLSKILGVFKSNVSQHLAVMRYTGIIKAERKGRNVFYKIANPEVIKLIGIIDRNE